jgi:pimeloyl-ACP methyl ester carboxylesterase
MKRITVRVVAGLAIVLAGLVVYGWAPDKTLAELKPQYAPPPSQFVEVEGVQVHYRDEGPRDDPSPIVLLHGTSASLHTWQGWVDAIGAQRRLVRLDLPGFGLTGPYADDDYTMKHYVRFLGAFLEAVGVSRPVLVGNSFGGNIAWHAAAAWGRERVQELVLVDGAGYAYKPKSMPIGFVFAQRPWLHPVLLHITPRSAIESSVRDVYGDKTKVTPELVDRYRDLTLRAGNRRGVIERFRQVRAGEDEQVIKDVKVRTLIVWGGADQLIPVENARRFHAEIEGSELAIVDGLGHVPHEEDPARSLEPVKAFLGLH